MQFPFRIVFALLTRTELRRSRRVRRVLVTDLELMLNIGFAIAAHWDPAHACPIVTVGRSANLCMNQTEYLLARVRPEAAR